MKMKGTKNSNKYLILGLLALWGINFIFLTYGFSQTTSSQEKIEQSLAQTKPEKIIPSPQNIKESTAIYVFVGWMWASIFILIYFLKLKIKESDRLFKLKFFSENK